MTNDTYDGPRCAVAISISTILWFCITHLVGVENIVLRFFPKVLRETLLEEATQAKQRLQQAKGLSAETTLLATYPVKNFTTQEGCASCLRYVFANNDNLSPSYDQIKDEQYLSQLRNRSAGTLNSIFSVFLAGYCVLFDSHLKNNKIFGVSMSWSLAGSFICGYFIWDLVVILSNYMAAPDNWQWLLHGVICLTALGSPFLAQVAPMSYYAAMLMSLEASSPFMGARWYCMKVMQLMSGNNLCQEHQNKMKVVKTMFDWASITFAITFFLVRVVFAPFAIFIPLLRIFYTHPIAYQFHAARWWLYVISIPLFWALNMLWMFHIVQAATKVRKNKQK